MTGRQRALTGLARPRRDTMAATLVIGLMLDDASSPYSMGIYHPVEHVARERGVRVLIGSLDGDQAREHWFAGQVDGLIIVSANLDGKRAPSTATVFIGRPPVSPPVDSVLPDNQAEVTAAITHLIGYGHRRIAFLGGTSSTATAQDRYTGYRETLRHAGLPEDPSLVVPNLNTAQAAQAAVSRLLNHPEPPSALFTSHNVITQGAVRALRAHGAQHSTALVASDDLPLAEILDPPVTVLAQDVLRTGTLAAQLLFRRIDGDTSPPEAHILSGRLIPRGSGEIPAPR